METHPVRSVEYQILSNLIAVANKHGFAPFYVGSPGDTEGVKVKSSEEMLKEVFELDDADVTFRKKGSRLDEDGKCQGFWVRLVGGNGEDFVSDYAVGAQHIIEETYKECGLEY